MKVSEAFLFRLTFFRLPSIKKNVNDGGSCRYKSISAGTWPDTLRGQVGNNKTPTPKVLGVQVVSSEKE